MSLLNLSQFTISMKNKIVLNFWQALLLLLSIIVADFSLCVITVLVFKDSYKTDPFQIFFTYLSILIYVPFIVWFAKKTDANLKESFFIPDLSTVIRMLIIVLLFYIVVFPIGRIDKLFESLMNSKLRIPGTTVRLFFPWLDLKMVLIGPIIEELFFRGLVLKNFLKKYTPKYAILLSSLLFGINHLGLLLGEHALSFYYIIFFIVLGIFYGILYYKTNSLIIVSLAHIIWNASTLLNPKYIELGTTSSMLCLFFYISAFIFLYSLSGESLKSLIHNETINNINE
jgi:uncharacterized protein